MTRRHAGLFASLLCSLPIAACWTGRPPPGYADTQHRIERPGLALGVDVPDPAAAEAALTGAQVSADDVVRAVLATSPELAELRARARAELAEVAADSALPPPELELEVRGAPLARPWALGEAEEIMIGLRQELAVSGRRDALARAALADAEVAAAGVTVREIDLAGRARRAHAAWYLAGREVALRDEQLGIIAALTEAIAAAYRANQADLEDTTRVEIMAVQLDQDRFAAAERLTSARAMINALTGRDPAAPLGTPVAPVPSETSVDPAALAGLQDRSRGELRAADAAIAREAAAGDVARADGKPRFMVGARYMFMPAAHDFQHGYGVMLSMTLPWLDRSRGGKAEAARHREVAERASEEATRAAVRYELAAAASQLRAARARVVTVRDQLLPRAERLYEVARVELGAGRGDAGAVLLALDSWLALRIDLERALADVAVAEADVERAVGAPLPRGGS